MRVLHINVNYIVSTLHQTMIEHLNQTGVESRVFVPTYDKTRAIIDCNDDVILSECFNKWDRIFFYNKQKKIIDSILSSYDLTSFDLIHAYTLFTDGNAALELSLKYNLPYVVTIRNTDLNDFFKKMIHLRSRGIEILKKASAVFFLSSAYKNTVLEKYVPSNLKREIDSKSYLIPNGIDDFWHDNIYIGSANEKLQRIKSEKKIRCIYVGGIDRNKNIQTSLKALEILSNKGWTCSLIVAGKVVNQSLFEQIKTNKHFCYVGHKSKEELITFYRESDLFIMPSHTETFGLVYAEAMSQGLPVIYTKDQGFDGQFAEGKVGFHVHSNNASEIADRIVEIIDNYNPISMNCIEGVNQFRWDTIVKKYCQIYHTIISSKTV